MHPPQVRDNVLDLVTRGLNDCEISRRTGIPRRTVRDMRVQPYVPVATRSPCPRCWRPCRKMTFSAADYCELLGLYLGDGHISKAARTERLRISLDSKYGRIVSESEGLLRRCFVTNSVGRQHQHEGRMTIIWVSSRHLSCLFPQHGPGPKHLRTIELEPWQETLVEREPWPLLRGLIRSDGCSFVNRTGPYEYPSYQFSNCSEGIVDLFLATCSAVDVFCRPTFDRKRRIWQIRINRRDSVALLNQHVGVKK